MNNIKSIAVILLLCAGCGTTHFTPYTGQQQSWPVAPGAFVDTNKKYVVPVYRGDPDRPYTVIGMLDIETFSSEFGAPDPLYNGTRQAKTMGADAVIVKEQGTVGTGANQAGWITWTGLFLGSSTAERAGTAKIVLIKFNRPEPTEKL